MEKSHTNAKIMIVDDQFPNVLLLEEILKEEDFTNLISITDSREALSAFMDHQPDLILLDLRMPHLDGYGVMRQLRKCIEPGTFLPILVLTADITPDTKRRALADGANDFLTKPFDHLEVILRIKNLLQTRDMHIQLQDQNIILERKVKERTKQLEASQIDILKRLAQAAEFRDDETGEHTYRVGELAAQIAERMGYPEKMVNMIRLVAPLHDIGKIGIPDSILLKAGKLSSDEWELMKTHATIGAKILSGSQSSLLKMAEEIAQTHHERWDGHGYFGLKGDQIPITGRIVSIADEFDALIHDRPYKKAWTVENAVSEIRSQSGEKFDPQVVDIFLSIIQETLTSNE